MECKKCIYFGNENLTEYRTVDDDITKECFSSPPQPFPMQGQDMAGRVGVQLLMFRPQVQAGNKACEKFKLR